MKIIFDNIIYSLQEAGGISMYWTELIKRLPSSDVIFYEQKNKNIFRKDLKISTNKESFIPSSIIRYLPFLGDYLLTQFFIAVIIDHHFKKT